MGLFKRKKGTEEGYESERISAAKPMDYLLNVCLHNKLPVKDEVGDGYIAYPDWQMAITPDIEQLDEHGAVVNFYITSPEWGKVLFECSAGMGDNPKQAMENSCNMFLLSFMQGIVKMKNEEPYKRLEVDFGGKKHRFGVYLSDIIGLGNSPQTVDADFYWNLLKDEIVKRLGNQKLCYVKVYGCKTFGDESIIGECRIDDVKSDELSNTVAKEVEKWNVEPFASQKTFFFIRQEEETASPYPYLGEKGWQTFKAKVRQAITMFYESDTQEKYDTFFDRLKEALDDDVLAEECFAFLPEICAENAFNNIIYPEYVQIMSRGQNITCYKSALADYNMLVRAIFDLFNEGVFGDDTDEIYRQYIGMSAIYSVICQAKEKDGEHAMEHGVMSSLIFQMGDNFTVR